MKSGLTFDRLGNTRMLFLRARIRGWNLPKATGDRNLAVLGGIYLILWILTWLLPASWSLVTNNVNLFVAVAFAVPAILRRPNAFPRSFPVVMLLVLQLWSFVCAIDANRVLGRPLAFGRVDTYLLLSYPAAFVGWRTSLVMPNFRIFGIKAFIVGFGLSSVVAWLQFLRIGPAMRLAQMYTYKPIDNWDGHPGIRAVGLSSQPNHLAFQAIVGLALVCAPALSRPLKRSELALAGLFAGAVVFTQSRAGILPLGVVGLLVLGSIARRDPKQFRKLAGGLTLALILGALIGAKRFGYLMMTGTSNDSSANMRESTTWAQLDPILDKLPLTGVGPSSGLFLGTGPEDKWVPAGRVVESGYLVFRAMYGQPGLLLLVIALAGSAISACWALWRTQDETQSTLLAAGLVGVVAIVFNAYSFNTFDSYLHLPLACFLAGFAALPFSHPSGHREMRRLDFRMRAILSLARRRPRTLHSPNPPSQ